MSPPDRKDLRHQAIRRTLDRQHGPDSGTAARVEAALSVWRDVTERLAPMIGTRGVDALVGRSMELATPRFPWLGPAGERVDGLGPLASFQARLEVQDPAVATEASVALLAAFTDLLAGMIGVSLTDRLLDPIWTAPPPASAKEQAP
jgi:hypothetical protein